MSHLDTGMIFLTTKYLLRLHQQAPTGWAWFLGRGRGETGRTYLSGVGLWLGRFEEGVWQLSHPHRYGRGHDSVFRVHHGVKKRLQVGFRVAPYMDDLVAGRRVMLARIHCPKTVCELSVSENVAFGKPPKEVRANPQLFFFFTQQEIWKSRRQSEKVIPGHSKVEKVE